MFRHNGYLCKRAMQAPYDCPLPTPGRPSAESSVCGNGDVAVDVEVIYRIWKLLYVGSRVRPNAAEGETRLLPQCFGGGPFQVCSSEALKLPNAETAVFAVRRYLFVLYVTGPSNHFH
jgi:hypothetical protein